MKSIAALSLVLLGFVVGCGDSSSSSSSSTNSVPSTNSSVGPADYYGALAKAQQNATKTVDTTAIQKAVDMFQVDKGRYPRDLDELVKEKYLPQIPKAPYGMRIVYDANTGTVRVVK